MIDAWVESAGRWAAARTTRRSFLGRFGRAAVLVASGPSMATLLAGRAEARVCGQTGVSPKCPTYECSDIWGWCWYAVGCCAEGKLKKICDCCAVNWPNVHGYCPSGTNVKCIVESCGADPRVQTMAIERLPFPAPFDPMASVRERYARGGSRVVLGNSESPLHVTVGAALSRVVDLPFLAVPPGRLDESTYSELARLGARQLVIAQPHLTSEDELMLTLRGYELEKVVSSADVRQYSGELAAYAQYAAGARHVVCVETSGVSLEVMPVAVALAHWRKLPLVVGASTRRAGGGAYLIGPEVSGGAPQYGGIQIGGPTGADVMTSLATVLLTERGALGPITLADDRYLVHAVALLAQGMPSFVHRTGSLDGARDQLFAYRHLAQRVYLVGDDASWSFDSHNELVSIVNRFEAHLLIGVAGQGLPVYQQPATERALGRARGGDESPPPFAQGAAKAKPVKRKARIKKKSKKMKKKRKKR